MAKHNTRDPRGRFTKSGAPIEGDPSACEHFLSPSANPQGEHDEPIGTVYPHEYHDPARGAYQRLIPQRHAIVIDAETGQQMAYAVDHEIRGVDAMMGGDLRAQAHLQATEGDPFISALMSRPTYDFHRQGHEHMMDTPGVDNDDATHHAWPGEIGQPMRDH
jgi:hypothetical protein